MVEVAGVEPATLLNFHLGYKYLILSTIIKQPKTLMGQVLNNLGTNKSKTVRLDLASPKVQIFLESKQIRKVIVVPERKVSIVCS